MASGKTKTKKRAGVQVYSRASSLETLVRFLPIDLDFSAPESNPIELLSYRSVSSTLQT